MRILANLTNISPVKEKEGFVITTLTTPGSFRLSAEVAEKLGIQAGGYISVIRGGTDEGTEALYLCLGSLELKDGAKMTPANKVTGNHLNGSNQVSWDAMRSLDFAGQEVGDDYKVIYTVNVESPEKDETSGTIAYRLTAPVLKLKQARKESVKQEVAAVSNVFEAKEVLDSNVTEEATNQIPAESANEFEED